MSKFRQTINIHQHSASSLDGAATVKQLVKRTKELGAPYIAITEHGHMHSAMEVYQTARKEGLKPILGIEAYLINPWHDEYVDLYRKAHAAGLIKTRAKVPEKVETELQNKAMSQYLHVTIHFKDEWAYTYFNKLSPIMWDRAIKRWDEEKPMLTMAELEAAAGHITISSSCLKGPVQSFLLPSRDGVVPACPEKAMFMYNRLREIAGKDSFFVEVFPYKITKTWKKPEFDHATKAIIKAGEFIQHECSASCPSGDIQLLPNQFVYELAKRNGDKALISLDAHFATENQRVIQESRLGNGSEQWKFSNSYHILTSDEAAETLKETLGISDKDVEEMIDNSYAFASHFDNFKIQTSSDRWILEGDPKEFAGKLRATIDKYGRMDWTNKAMTERLQHEIQVLANNGKINLLPYFAMVEDIANFCRNNDVLLNVRGSAGGSILLYLIGVSAVNPLKHDLSFERFLTAGRIKANTLPDVDMDISDQEKVFEYLRQKHGDKFCRISTDVLLKIKSSIKDVERATFGYVRKEAEDLCKKLPTTPQGIEDKDFVFGYTDQQGIQYPGLYDTSPDLRKYAIANPKLWEIISECLGIQRCKSSHACGVIIADKPVQEYCPIMHINGQRVTGFSPKSIEAAGLVKLDMLGLNTLRDIQQCLASIKGRLGITLDPWNLPHDDKCFDNFCAGKTETVFQFDTNVVRPYLTKIKPRDIEEIANITALCRPGTLDAPSGDGRTLAEVYVGRKQGEPVTYIHLDMEPILKNSMGTCIAVGQKVHTISGIKTIENINIGDSVLTHTGEFKKVSHKINNGTKDTIKIRFNIGRELICTPDHLLLTQNGWKEAGSLLHHDIVKFFWETSCNEKKGTVKDWIVGLLLADGDITGNTPDLACSSKEFAEAAKTIIDTEFGLNSKVYLSGTCWHLSLAHRRSREKFHAADRRNPLKEYLKDIGIWGKDCYSKRLPPFPTLEMIAGFFEGDGCIKNGNIRIKNKQLAEDIYSVLDGYRIPSSIFHTIDGVSTVRLLDPNKLPMLIKIRREPHKEGVRLYTPNSLLPSLPKAHKWYGRRYAKRKINGQWISTNTVPRYIIDSLQVSGHKDWASVCNIVTNGRQQVYDLTVDDNHSFIVGGHTVHNCLFQEQTLRIFRDIGGFSYEEAEAVRRGIGKKDQKVLAESSMVLRKACLKRGWTVQQVDLLIDQIMASAKYSFNKSHAVSYAYVAYACMYLKTNFPLDWWKAALSNASKDEVASKFWKYVQDFTTLPDINKSGNDYIISEDRIIAPISLLKGVGEKAYAQLIKFAPYENLEQFVNLHLTKRTASDRSPVTTGTVKKLIAGGVIDSLYDKAYTIEEKLEIFENFKAKAKGEYPKPIAKEYEEYIGITTLGKFLIKKEILSVYSQDLRPIMLPNRGGESISDNDGNLSWRIAAGTDNEGNLDKIFVLDGNQIEWMKDFAAKAPLTGFDTKYWAGLAYVIEEKSFPYKQKTKQATKLVIDINGYFSEEMLWPAQGEDIAESGFKGEPCLVIYKQYKDRFVVSRLQKLLNCDEKNRYTVV